MREERIVLHLVRNATSAINGIISHPCANLGIIVATSPENRSQGEEKGARIKKTNEHAESTNLEDEFFSQAAEHQSQAKKIREIGKDESSYRTVTERLNAVYVVMETDSGADVNIIEEHQFKTFIHATNDN